MMEQRWWMMKKMYLNTGKVRYVWNMASGAYVPYNRPMYQVRRQELYGMSHNDPFGMSHGDIAMMHALLVVR